MAAALGVSHLELIQHAAATLRISVRHPWQVIGVLAVDPGRGEAAAGRLGFHAPTVRSGRVRTGIFKAGRSGGGRPAARLFGSRCGLATRDNL